MGNNNHGQVRRLYYLDFILVARLTHISVVFVVPSLGYQHVYLTRMYVPLLSSICTPSFELELTDHVGIIQPQMVRPILSVSTL